MADNRIWYVSYGTNMLEECLMVYINGGKFRGKGKGKDSAIYPGCTNKSPPIASKPYMLPYELYYGRKSKTWNNSSIAFIDADKPGITLGRAYLITEEQFSEIHEQEGSAWYNRTVEIAKDPYGVPYKTFTSTDRHQNNEPNANYTNVMFEGLCETFYPHLPYSRFHRLMLESIKHLGKPYASSIRSNGKGPDAFDCVWFVGWVFRESGVDNILKRYALPKLDKAFTKVGINEIKREGDVLFFCRPPSEKIIHVGIYIDHNLMIHATQPNSSEVGSVRLDDITKGNWLNRLVAIGRISA